MHLRDRPRRRLRVALGVLVGAPLGLAAMAPLVGAHLVRTRALPRLSDRIGRAITVRDVRVRWGEVQIDDLRVDGAGGPAPLEVPRVTASFGVGAVLRGKVKVDKVVLEKPHIEVVRGEGGDDNISSILEKLRARRAEAGEGGGAASSA